MINRAVVLLSRHLFAAKIATIFETTKFVAHNFFVQRQRYTPQKIRDLRDFKDFKVLKDFRDLFWGRVEF